MTMPGTETETGQSLESVLKEGQVSAEQEETSEEEIVEEVKKPENMEQEEWNKLSPESQVEATKGAGDPSEKIQSMIQSGIDKGLNSYRAKQESQTSLIRSLQAENKELKVGKSQEKFTKAIETVLSTDEEEGIPLDTIEERRKAFSEIKATIKDYNEKSGEVGDVAALVASVADSIDKGVADHFSLFDSNPAVRTKGITLLISDAAHIFEERKAFDRIVSEIPLLQKGEEVRQQIDSFVERYMELSDDKGKDLLINQLKQEFKIAPRKKLPVPSDVSGGLDLSKLSSEELIERGLRKMGQSK